MGAYALGLATSTPWLRRLWLYVEWVAIPFLPVAWLAFALAYAGWGSVLSRRRLAALSVLPAALVAAAWTNPLHRLLWSSNELVVEGGVPFLVQSFGRRSSSAWCTRTRSSPARPACC